jgi:hypothetical protein
MEVIISPKCLNCETDNEIFLSKKQKVKVIPNKANTSIIHKIPLSKKTTVNKGKYNLCKHNKRYGRCIVCESGGLEICRHLHQKFSCKKCKLLCCHNKITNKCNMCYIPFNKYYHVKEINNDESDGDESDGDDDNNEIIYDDTINKNINNIFLINNEYATNNNLINNEYAANNNILINNDMFLSDNDNIIKNDYFDIIDLLNENNNFEEFAPFI